METRNVPLELLNSAETILRLNGYTLKAAELKKFIDARPGGEPSYHPPILSKEVQQLKDQLNAKRYELLRDGARRGFIVVRDRQCHLQAEVMDQAIDKLLEQGN